MKLNNHGWGLKDMIIYSCILLFFLFLAASSVNSFYDGLQAGKEESERRQNEINENAKKEEEKEIVDDIIDNSNTNPVIDYDYYNNREKELQAAALGYLNYYNYDLESQIMKITLDTLIGLGYIQPIYDQTSYNICTGYVNAYYDEDASEYVVNPYLNCSGYYITEGY